MSPLYLLILWTMCCGDRAMPSVVGDEALPELTLTTIQPDMNETDYNRSLADAESAFRKRLTDAVIHIDTQNFTIPDLPPLSNTSLSDIQNDNSTQIQLLRIRNKNKLQRIQAIRDYILQATWNNRTLNGTRVSERTPRETDDFFRRIPLEDETIDDFIKTLKRESSEAGEQFTDGVISYMNVEPSEVKKLKVKFSELGLDDVVIAPEGVRWPVCNGIKNVHAEILRRMTNPQYPSPLRFHARTMMNEFQMEIDLRELPKCIPSGTKSMSIIYYDDDEAIKTDLINFVPTGCSCLP